MIYKVHRFIFLSSIAIICIFFILIALGKLFFDNFSSFPTLKKTVETLMLITPFAPIGTLFGTLKDNQSPAKKINILLCTGATVLLLIITLWGTALASTFD